MKDTAQTITKWPLAERPREKLLSLGAKYLSDAELIAIFLRTGIRGKTALDISRELLAESGTLKKLLNAEANHFTKIAGIGKAKLAMLKAAIELGRRYAAEDLTIGESLHSSIAIKRLLASRLNHYPNEVFACLFLDNRHRVLSFEELFHGTLTEANVYPREIIKRCLAHNAAKVILAHNHPSGDPEPSTHDIQMTLHVKKSLLLVDIHVLDHIIVGHKECVSLAERGLL